MTLREFLAKINAIEGGPDYRIVDLLTTFEGELKLVD